MAHAFGPKSDNGKVSEENENAVFERVGNRDGNYCCCIHAHAVQQFTLRLADRLTDQGRQHAKWVKKSPSITNISIMLEEWNFEV